MVWNAKEQALKWQGALPQTAICARNRYALITIKCDTPVLIIPFTGTKNIIHGKERFSVSFGEYIMIHTPIQVGMENIPDLDFDYIAGVINFPWKVVELAKKIILNNSECKSSKINTADISHKNIPSNLQLMLNQYLELNCNDAVHSLLDSSLISILIALFEDNSTGFLNAEDISLSSKIRLMVEESPEYEWSAAAFEDTFHMSGATLRRRLAKENTSLRILIREARLHAALGMFQTSRKTLSRVALDCGFSSATILREGFVELFGVDPSLVSND